MFPFNALLSAAGYAVGYTQKPSKESEATVLAPSQNDFGPDAPDNSLAYGVAGLVALAAILSLKKR